MDDCGEVKKFYFYGMCIAENFLLPFELHIKRE